MKYIGQFKSINNKLYEVEIISNNSSSETTEITLAGDEPVIIEQESDGLFSPIKSRACTVKIVSPNYYFDMYTSTAQGTPITITNKTDNVIEFRGYLTPNVYNQEWKFLNVIELEAIESLSTLQYYDYEPIDGDYSIQSFYSILKYMLYDIGGYTKMNVTKDLDANVFKNLGINEMNFTSDDGEWKLIDYVLTYDCDKTKCKDALSYICQYFNLSCMVFHDEIYLVNYYGSSNNVKDFYIYDFSNDSSSATKSGNLLYTITSSSYKSAGGTIELAPSYNKINVECNMYEIGTDAYYPDVFDITLTNTSNGQREFHKLSGAVIIERMVYLSKYYTSQKVETFVYGDGTIDQKLWSIYNNYTPENLSNCIGGYNAPWYNDNIIKEPISSSTHSVVPSQIYNFGTEYSQAYQSYFQQLGCTILRTFNYLSSSGKPATTDWTDTYLFGLGCPQVTNDTWIDMYNSDLHTNYIPCLKYTSTTPLTFGTTSDKSAHFIINGKILYNMFWPREMKDFTDDNFLKKRTEVETSDDGISHLKSTQCFAGLQMSIKVGDYYLYPEQSWETHHGYKTFNYGNRLYSSTDYHAFYIPCESDNNLVYNDWMNFFNTVEYDDNLSQSGYKLTIWGNEIYSGTLEVTLLTPYLYKDAGIDRSEYLAARARPRWALVKDFSFKYLVEDCLWYEPDYEEKDVTYYNIPDEEYVDELDSIDLKICTQTDDKKQCYSSVINMNTKNYITNVNSTSLQGSQTQEKNIIEQQYEHYNTPKKILSMSIPYQLNNDVISPIHIFDYNLLDNAQNMFMDSNIVDLKMNKQDVKLIEF